MRLNNSGNLYLRSESVNYLVLGNSGDATSNNITNNMNWVRGNAANVQYNTSGGFHAWEVSGAEQMKLSAEGYLTKPKQPLAIIGVTDNNHTPASGEVIEWDYVDTNRGGHFDTVNHKFTCPVAGDYMVIFNHARTGWVGDLALEKAPSGAGYTVIRRLELREVGQNNSGNADWQAACYSYIIPCNAGDQLRWTVTNTVWSNLHTSRTCRRRISD